MLVEKSLKLNTSVNEITFYPVEVYNNGIGIHATHQITLEIVIIASKQTEDLDFIHFTIKC
jgi:hypothetical protein